MSEHKNPTARVLLLVLLALVVGGIAWWASTIAGDDPEEGSTLLADAPRGGEQERDRDIPRTADDSLAEPAEAPGRVENEEAERAGIASAERRAVEDVPGASFNAADAVRVEGRVVLPPGSPADETLSVVCSKGAAHSHERPVGFAAVLETPPLEASRIGASDSPRSQRAPVRPDGTFVAFFPPDAKTGTLELEGRFLYLDEPVEVRLGANPQTSVVLEPELGAWVHGRLLFPGGEPPAEEEVDEIDVRLRNETRQANMFDIRDGRDRSDRLRVEASEDGTFELRGVPAGSYRLLVEPEVLALAEIEGVRVEPGQDRRLDVTLLSGGTIRGRVVDENGAPVAGAEIDAGRIGAGFFGMTGSGKEAESLEDGTFELPGLPPGKLMLSISKDGYLPGIGTSIEVEDGSVHAGVELVLSRGSYVAGVVQWSDGRPADGARVEAMLQMSGAAGMNGMTAWRGMQGDAETDESGAFRISGLGNGPFRISVLHSTQREDGAEETGWASVDKVAADTSGLLLTLQPSLTLTGIVTDMAGTPVQRFRVKASRGGSSPFGFAERMRSGGDLSEDFETEDGSFTLAGFQEGEWSVRIEADGFGHPDPTAVEMPSAASGPPLVFTLLPASSVAGVVLDPEGEPVSGARVSLKVEGGFMAALSGAPDPPRTESGDGGAFLLENVTPGDVALVASAKEWASSAGLPVSLEPGASEEGVVLKLRRGGRITGEVFGEDGKPASGRNVIAQIPTGEAMQTSSTDADGRFEFDRLTPGNYQVIAMLSTESMLSSMGENEEPDMGEFLSGMKFTMVEVKDEEEVHVVLGAPPEDPVSVRGRITAAGEPVSSMLSFFAEGASTLESLKMVQTKADGTYSIDLDKPGQYVVSVQQIQGMGQQSSLEFHETIPASDEVVVVDFELPLGSISGTVYGPDGAAMEGARISLTSDEGILTGSLMGSNYNETQTDENGRYSIAYLKEGRYAVSAGGAFLAGLMESGPAPGRVIKSGVQVRANSATEGVDFRLGRAGTITGTVVDRQGKPVGGAAIFIRDEQGRVLERMSMTVSDSAGRFRYPGVTEGSYTVSARSDDLASPESAKVHVPEGGKADVQVVIEDGVVLILTVLGDDDEPIRASVVVTDEDGNQVNGLLSMADLTDAFTQGFNLQEQRVGPFAPGSYVVEASTSDGRSVRKPVTLRSGERRLKLRLRD